VICRSESGIYRNRQDMDDGSNTFRQWVKRFDKIKSAELRATKSMLLG
jgi:hypothetical protein